MKKLALIFSLTLLFFTAAAINLSADENDGIVDLYPYDQPGCMTVSEPCTRTRVGAANWTFEYFGHRYHYVSSSVRYVVDFEDENADGYIDATEMPAISWPSFGSAFINDTDEGVILKTENARTDLTGGVVDRMYAYFDENGQLAMFEDHLNMYYIHNDGDAENPEWRMATEGEIDAYDASDEPETDTPNTITSPIRIAVSDNAQGYEVEPIGWLSWRAPGIDINEDPVEEWSLIMDGDPEYVHIHAGWTVVTFGTLDRDNSNKATTEFIPTLADAILDDSVEPFTMSYEDQPATFFGIALLDDDANTPGVTAVVEYNGTFDFDPSLVNASWLNMFDEEGNIINQTEFLDYQIVIEQDGDILQTIDFTYDEGTATYTASESVNVIDASEFGSGYTATFVAETPLGDITEYPIDIVIGVMPPTFVGVDPRFVNEKTPVDPLEGITADDGYGNDLTSSIEVVLPAGFNRYSPEPGSYTIDLSFIHNVFFPGDPWTLTINGEEQAWEGPDAFNTDLDINVYAKKQVWDDAELFRDIGSAWGSVMIVVDGDGNMSERYDRYNWEYTDENGTIVGDADHFANWQATVELDEGGFIIGAHGSVETPPLRAANLDYGDPVAVEIGTEDFSYDILTETSYVLTIDDVTPPTPLIVNSDYTIESGQFTNINNAILSNVVAVDNFDTPDQLAIYVSNNGGLNLQEEGTYTVEVTVEDRAGNMATASFDVNVVAPLFTEDDMNNKANTQDVEDMLDARLLTEETIQAMIDSAVQEAIDNLPEDETGASMGAVVITGAVSALVALTGAVGLMIKKPF